MDKKLPQLFCLKLLSILQVFAGTILICHVAIHHCVSKLNLLLIIH